MTVANEFYIELKKEANQPYSNFGVDGNTFDRIRLGDDITSVVLHYDDEPEEIIYLDYDEVNGQGNYNLNQSSWISSKGNLYIVVQAGKNVKDIFSDECKEDTENDYELEEIENDTSSNKLPEHTGIYSIPKAIKNKIPDYFYMAMAGELVSIFGADVLKKYDGDDIHVFEYHESTSGWVAAFKATCRKLDMKWLADYWDGLEWDESDLFDGEIGDKIVNILPMIDESANSYYSYLLTNINI